MSVSEVIEKPVTHEQSTFNAQNRPGLQECIVSALQQYFAKLEGQSVTNLYDMVLAEVEVPLLEAVMRYCRGNQSKAAIMLGISRGTLRKKLKIYNID